MTYGLASPTTEATLASAGLLDRLTIPADEVKVIEVDIVCDGALDESFQVQANFAEDVAAVLFEDICETHPLLEVEVSVYDRTSEDDARLIREHTSSTTY